MKWSIFLTCVALLITGNILVHAQNVPTVPTLPNVPTSIPNDVLRAIDVPPEQVARLPRPAQREVARQRSELVDRVLQNAREINPVAHGGVPMMNSTAASSANPQSSAPSSEPDQGQSPLTLTRNYLNNDSALNSANIAQTLALATANDIHLWKGYYDSMYDKVEGLKRSYERVRDSLRRYGDQVTRMLDALPATIVSCTR